MKRNPLETASVVYFLRFDPVDQVVHLAARDRTLSSADTHGQLMQSLQELLAGPNEQELLLGYFSAIPNGTKVRDVRIEASVAYADFSAELESGGGSASMLSRIYQIVYTATEVKGVRSVRVLIEGEFRKALGGEGLIVESPLMRPSIFPTF